MDTAMADETKPFEGDAPAQDDWNQPDPDEELMLSQGSGRAWLVKVQSSSTYFQKHDKRINRFHYI